MKCLKISGDDRLADEFISKFSGIMQSRKICVISESESGKISVSFPSSATPLAIIRSMPPDIVLLRSDAEFAAPVIHCGINAADDDPLLLVRYTGNDSRIDPEQIYEKTFSLLPQKTAEECGKCKMDCMSMAKAIIRGDMSEGDCVYSPGSVEVKLGNRIVALSGFPAEMIEGTVRGLVSSLKGYSDEEDISITVRSDG